MAIESFFTGGSVAVAMSGGVDSSLSAALLLEQGYPVSGVTMRLWQEKDGPASCCGPAAAAGARQVCQQLGLSHTVVDLEEPFRELVMEAFLREYSLGRTPNPCIACNLEIKFGLLLDWARRQGFRWLATGHYARVEQRGPAGRRSFHLLQGIDRSRDQSYALYMLGQEELAHLLLPLGELHKTAVRQEARRRHLTTAGRPESREICFIPDDDYRRFIAEHLPQAARPGPIRDLSGKILGQHRGLPYYTVGQRRGLGLSGHPNPLFLIAINAAENALVVGPQEALYRSALEAEGVSFVSGRWPREPLEVQAKIRYRAPQTPGRLIPQGAGRVRLEFHEPQLAVTPGQAVVFYQGEEVLGGGTICAPGRTV